MNEPVDKVYSVPKDDPEYDIKVSEVLKKRFAEEKKKSVEREKAKMDAGRNKASVPVNPANPVRQPTNSANDIDHNKPVEVKDPEEVLRRKDILPLVAQLNNSFAIIEKFRLRTEKILKKIEKSFSDEE